MRASKQRQGKPRRIAYKTGKLKRAAQGGELVRAAQIRDG